MFTTKKIVLVSVINDLVTDNRVNKTCLTLTECGYSVVLIGRKLPNSLPIPEWDFKTTRMNLLFKKGPSFYLFFNIRLFFKLLFTKCDLLYSNDLDTLLPNYLISRLKKVPLIYDSHELFCDVPELVNSPTKRKIWMSIEKRIIPKLKNCITVNYSIAKIFEEKYKVNFTTVRNIPTTQLNFVAKTRPELNLPPDEKIIILQGAGINIDRGAEELVDAMAFIENAILLIIGSGDVWEILKQKIKNQHLEKKVKLINKLPKSELMHYTFNADLGITIDKNTNLNYFYSLPNKIFDYIHAQLPVLASRLPEIENIILRYNIGMFIDNHEPNHIANKILEILSSAQYKDFKNNTKKILVDLNWENEKLKLIEVIKRSER
ncbi:MAG: glycosyltransferase [Bacteroidota bacterium]|nr:glycosyltransferase [Bacteroidota bacterium]